MRSASSSTTTCDMAQVEHVLLEVVDDAARRADQHVDAFVELAALLVVVDAAEDQASFRPVCLPSTCASLWICTASSRVGAITMRADASSSAAPRAAGRVSSVWNSATRKAAVLPVPVCAWPATSLPVSAMGSVWAWIGVQRVKPASLNAAAPRLRRGQTELKARAIWRCVRRARVPRSRRGARAVAIPGTGRVQLWTLETAVAADLKQCLPEFLIM